MFNIITKYFILIELAGTQLTLQEDSETIKVRPVNPRLCRSAVSHQAPPFFIYVMSPCTKQMHGTFNLYQPRGFSLSCP